MAITKITYNAATSDLGDVTEQDAINYRNWARSVIQQAYKDSEVEVINGSDRDYAFSDLEDVCDREREIEDCKDFMKRLSDSCPWNGDFFD